MVDLSFSVRIHSKKTLVSGSILVHAGALFIPLILIVAGCQNDNTYSEAPYFKSVC